ncbi:MarR family winged helix-turn-helix transcriptional regulator [Elizabethkingia anophelis]|uniref:MarR family transcriptional regulator n=3 Tax=Elizabethkingia anophelis TaxID=1117645 RepID=A0AAE4NZN1_9FLAO|nr:MarR family transcriptional regulator [Elizabethkingia anophelis]ATC38065.1 MarR family transcriptional regulator [Elizabethkingia anophelis R26]ATC41744.1 MarR family transcriptional regulator [Elizabethkingia anophelis Ag1]ATC45421.1 MarR family transcriptional regulator [Elizabethkingia anophelis]ATC49097.1 MarR family transcriptional regulator [Elizabethkingia anophelis]EJC8060820.1 MarR family transcriptional regulator [Elizabethkingia anophelis]
MDFIKTLGYKALDSRLKRISDRMSHDVRKLYKEIDIDIEPNWYLIFMLLQNRGEISIADIAESLGYSHPSVVVIVKKMSEKDYLHMQKDKDDKRKQLVSLSSKATEILPELELIWQSCESAILKLLSDDLSIFSFLDDIDAELKANSFYNRFKQEYQKSINT